MKIVEVLNDPRFSFFRPHELGANVNHAIMSNLNGNLSPESYNLFLTETTVKQTSKNFTGADCLIISMQNKNFNYSFNTTDYNIFKKYNIKKVILNFSTQGGIGGFEKDHLLHCLKSYKRYFNCRIKIVCQNQKICGEGGLDYFNFFSEPNFLFGQEFDNKPVTLKSKLRPSFFNYSIGCFIDPYGVRHSKIKSVESFQNIKLLKSKFLTTSTLFKEKNNETDPSCIRLKKMIPGAFKDENFFSKISAGDLKGENYDYFSGSRLTIDQDIYNNTYLSIIQDTECESYTNRYTEKIIKAIAMKHPFVLIGNYKALDLLRSEGFKTFDGFIDESYDSVVNSDNRIKTACLAVKKFSKFTKKDWTNFYKKTKHIREHNYSTLFSKEYSRKKTLEKVSILHNNNYL